MRVFITGSESFIGSVLWDQCQAKGYELSGLDALPSRKTGSVQMDLRDARLVDCIPEGACIIHLAAVSTDPLCQANPLEALDINLTGTLNLARAARKKGCAQFIFASTEWVYGEVANQGIQVEDQPLDVTRISSVYAFSKLTGERVLALSGLENVTILRFGIVYGPRRKNWSAVEKLFDSVCKGEEIRVGSLQTARRFIFVHDLCDGILAALGQKGFEVFNLSGDHLITLGDVIQTSQTILGKRVEVIETNPDAPSIRNPDNAQARRLLGWRPQTSLSAGLTRVAALLAGEAEHG